MPIISESSEGGAIQGTDAALPNGRPAVEIIMDGSMRRESNAVPGSETTSSRMAASLAKRMPAAVAPVPEVKAAEAAPVETPVAATPNEPVAAAASEAPAVEPAPVVEPPKEEPKPEIAAPQPANTAELDATRQEAAILRAQLQGRATTSLAEERAAYLADPIAAVRAFQARLLGIEPTDKRLDEELSHLQSELTYAQVGADTLPDDRKWQRHQEHQGREKRLQQLAPDTSGDTRAAAAQAVSLVSAALKAAEKDHPYLAYAAELDRIDPAQAAVDVWTAEHRAGRTKATTEAEAVQEALRLTNDHYRNRAERLHKLRPADTAPTPAPAPAQASTQAVAPGAQKQQPSTAPVTTGSASPTTLSAKQAAAAPATTVTPADDSNAPITVDPFDRDAERERRLSIARRHRQK